MYKAHSQLTTHLHLLLGCQLCWRLAQDHLHSWAGCRHHEAHATQGLAGLLVAQEQQQLPCAAHVAGLQADLQRRVLIQYALRATSKGKRRAVTVTCLQHHLMPITQTQACKGRAEHQPNCNSPPMLPPPHLFLGKERPVPLLHITQHPPIIGGRKRCVIKPNRACCCRRLMPQPHRCCWHPCGHPCEPCSSHGLPKGITVAC